jgi:hypothetical protein
MKTSTYTRNPWSQLERPPWRVERMDDLGKIATFGQFFAELLDPWTRRVN